MGHEELPMPEGDLLIHAGDISGMTSIQELISFNHWLGTLGYDKVILTAGNHDGQFDEPYLAKQLLSNATVLLDDIAEYKGFIIYGSPYTIEFGNWWFMKTREELAEHWKRIPDKSDIVITHMPPYGILDNIIEGRKRKSIGCPALRKEILERVKPKLHVFGHLHLDGGKSKKIGDTTFVNAAMMDEDYRIARRPVVIDL